MASTASPATPQTGSAAPSLASDASGPEEAHSEGSKLKTFITILRKWFVLHGLPRGDDERSSNRFIGVTDLASVRFSLPSQLLEPTPNLEYWTYLDAPNAFVAIGTSDDPLDRMLEVLRFWFTKDLKYAKGKPCKPYNSCLGEFFRCNWETEDNAPKIEHMLLSGSAVKAGTSSSGSSTKSSKSGKASGGGLAVPGADPRSSSTVSVPHTSADTVDPEKLVRVSYLTEQTSHHPPVSAFYVSCPAKGLYARGFDQITAKFTGTSIKVMPGEHNLGIFITVDRRGGETYQLTHPAAHLGGILRGALSVSVGECAYITCPETGIKAILQYVEDGWLGRAQNRVEGVVFRYDPAKDDKVRIRDVPDEDVLVRLNGAWKEKIVFTVGPKPVDSFPPDQRITIIDLAPLSVATKSVPPLDSQLPNESLALWNEVTRAIHNKQFSRATVVKQELEEAQREKARERAETGEKWTPVFFVQTTGNGGKPDLTEKGHQVLERAQRGVWDLDGVLP